MPTYSIKAPDGKTYQITGPDGASDDQVRAEVLRQNPNAGKAPATFLSTAARAAYNLPMDTAETLKGVMMSPVEIAKMAFTKEGRAGAKSMATGAADILTGGLQHVRELSPVEHRGSAPAFDKEPFDRLAAETKENYGTKQGLYRTVGNKPAGTALAIASILDPALRVGGVKGGVVGAVDRAVPKATYAAGRQVRKVTDPVQAGVQHVTGAERRAKAAAGEMRADATVTFKGGQQQVASQIAAEEARAARAAALAEKSRVQGRALDTRRAAAAEEATPPPLEIGAPRHLSELGDDLRNPAMARQDEITTQMRDADNKYRSAMEAVAADRAAAGVGVSDSATARVLIKRSRELVKPDPVKRPSVGSVPADSAGGKLHQMLLDVLEPKEVPLTVKEAASARRAGIKVNTAPDGSFTRTIKPDLKAVDDYRRFLGKVLEGKIEGFEAINRVEAQQLYGHVSKVIDKYVGGASKPVQKNWRDGMAALEPFDKVRAGQAVVGTQGATNVASVPAANIPGRVVSGGRDTIRQTAAVAGEAPVAATLRSQVQNTLATAKTSAEVDALVRPGTKLGDAINADADLAERVASYNARLKASEAAAGRVTTLERRAQIALKRSSRLEKTAVSAKENAAKAADIARTYERDIAALEIAEPRDVGTQYTNMLKRAHKDGLIDTTKYQDGLKLAARAEKDFKLKTTRDRWIRYAGYLAGLGVAPGLAADILSHKD